MTSCSNTASSANSSINVPAPASSHVTSSCSIPTPATPTDINDPNISTTATNPTSTTTTPTVVDTTSPAIVAFAELPPTDRTPAIPIVIKTYLIRDITRHNLTAAVQSERTALVRLSTTLSPHLPRLLAAHATSTTVTLTLSRASGIPASKLPLPLKPWQAARIVLDLIRALEIVHAHGIVHGDVVPRNVVVDVKKLQSSTPCSALVDFGACFLNNELSRDASLTTTPAILAPEVRHASTCTAPTPLADIWALGILLWTLLSKPCTLSTTHSNQSSPPSLPHFISGSLSLSHAFWPDCTSPKSSSLCHRPNNTHCPTALLAAFDFVNICLQQDPLLRFCAVSDRRLLQKVPWSNVVDYAKLKSHPFLKAAPE